MGHDMDGTFHALTQALSRAGWLDRQSQQCRAALAAITSPTANGFRTLRDYWQALANGGTSAASRERWAARAEWANAQLVAGSRLGVLATTLHATELGPTMPVGSNTTIASDQAHLVYWPHGLPPHAHWSAVVSSRVGRRGFENRPWIAALRDACLRMQQAQALLVAAKCGTIGESLAQAAAQLYGLDLLLVSDATKCSDSVHWLRTLKNGSFPRGGQRYEVHISPGFTTSAETLDQVGPLRDRLLFDWCDDLFVLHVRPDGNIERLIRRSLAERPSTRVHLATGRSLIPPDLAEELIRWGASPWTPQSCDSQQPQMSDVAIGCACPATTGATTAADELLLGKAWLHLTHCTRAQSGPWPGQTEDAFYGELLRGDFCSPRTAMTSLTRIVREKLLRAQGRGIRGGSPVVCFSEVPLLHLLTMRTFQAHRGRWDFEPYGICIRRDWLEKRGCKPVLYGTDQDWEKLPPADRPYFQRSTTTSSRQSRELDWTKEREWRHVGDIDLDHLPRDAGFLFTRTLSDVGQLAPLSPWPVIALEAYLGELTQSGCATSETSARWPERSRRRNSRAAPKKASR